MRKVIAREEPVSPHLLNFHPQGCPRCTVGTVLLGPGMGEDVALVAVIGVALPGGCLQEA